MIDQLKIYSLLWAKKKDNAGKFWWLPLSMHLQDTMAVMRFLWQHWLSMGQKEIIVKSLSYDNMTEDAALVAEKLACFLAGVHDIGKCTPVFQTQKGYQNSVDLDKALLNRLELAGLTDIAKTDKTGFNNDERQRSHHTITGEYLLGNFGVKSDIASIIGAHHGKPADTPKTISDLNDYQTVLFQTEKGPQKEIWQNMQRHLLNKALQEADFVNADSEPDIAMLPSISEPGQVLLSGLVIMADWIASNEEYFPLINLENTISNEKTRWQNGIKKWFEQNPSEAPDIIDPAFADDYYQKRFGFLPREFQEKVFTAIAETDEPGIFILEAPMGGGKTEAALAAAEELMAKKKLNGLFFGLPTQATSNGIFPRINDWLKNLADEYGVRETMKLMHGKAALNELQDDLTQGVYVDEDYGSGVLTVAWFAGRKTAILSDAVVGTVDHFLLAALKQKHLALRHLGLAKKIIIIDEVHAYDAYMDVFLTCAIKWMGAYGIPVVLLSATLPAEIRQKLIRAYLSGQGHGIRDKEVVNYAAIFDSENYPLLTYTDKGKIYQKKDFVKEKDRQISVKALAEENLVPLLKQLLVNGGVVGIIVNTVKRSQAIFAQLVANFGDIVSLLHAKFIDTDRLQKETTLMQNIGKGANRPKQAIIVGTQVLEQSLDIDFDVLITDLCPMDLLLQRVGRLQRHDITRPQGMNEPVLYVMGQSDILEFEKGAVAIYGTYLLARTQKILPKEKIAIPSDISKLVQRVYGEEELVYPAGIKESYEQAKKQHLAKLDKENAKAKSQFLLGKPHLKIKPEKNNLIGWLETAAVADSEENAIAQVRDAEESIEIIALLKCGNGYGYFAEKEDISTQITNYEVAKEVAKQTLKLSRLISLTAFGSVAKTIGWLEEYNQGNLAVWQQQPWLKGSLGIIFEPADDGNTGKFVLGDITLTYNSDIGLQMIKNSDG